MFDMLARTEPTQVCTVREYSAVVCVAPDGGTMAVGCDFEGVRVFDEHGGKLRIEIPVPAKIRALCFSPDSSRLAIGDGQGTIRIVDARNGDEAWRQEAHADAVVALAFMADGAQVASAGLDDVIRRWKIGAPQELNRSDAQPDGILSACFSRDGSRVAIGGMTGTIRVLDTADGRVLLGDAGEPSAIGFVAFAEAGARLVSLDRAGRLRSWDVAKRLEAAASHEESWTQINVQGADISPDGRVLALPRTDGSIQLVDASSHDVLRALVGHVGSVRETSFSDDGRRLVSAGDDGTARIWGTDDGNEIASFTPPDLNRARAVSFSKDADRIAVTLESGAVCLWKPGSGRTDPESIVSSGQVEEVRFSPDGRTCCFVGRAGDSTLRLRDADCANERAVIHGTWLSPPAIRFSPDGTLLAILEASQVVLWSTTDGSRVSSYANLDPDVALTSLAWSKDGRALAVGNSDSTISLIELDVPASGGR